jgi:hypothetical protein
MTMPIRVAVAANFHLPGAAADRLLLADGTAWRMPTEAERAVLAPPTATPDAATVLLFTLPGHLCASFWSMMEQSRTADGFDAFAVEVSRFLSFKELPPPARAVFELVLHAAGGNFEPHGLWAIVNLSDDPVAIDTSGLRVRLGTGEGCRLPNDVAAEVTPADGDTPDVLLIVREPET